MILLDITNNYRYTVVNRPSRNSMDTNINITKISWRHFIDSLPYILEALLFPFYSKINKLEFILYNLS